MEPQDRSCQADRKRDYRTLPPAVALEDTIASVDPSAAPDPDGGRNVDQHRALRDD